MRRFDIVSHAPSGLWHRFWRTLFRYCRNVHLFCFINREGFSRRRNSRRPVVNRNRFRRRRIVVVFYHGFSELFRAISAGGVSGVGCGGCLLAVGPVWIVSVWAKPDLSQTAASSTDCAVPSVIAKQIVELHYHEQRYICPRFWSAPRFFLTRPALLGRK